jgi:hypothetical protein
MDGHEVNENVGTGPQVRIIQDANGHFFVERDGVPVEEALHRGNRSDALMRADGYRLVAEVYPGITEPPLVPGGVDLNDVYVLARRITDDPTGRDGWTRRRGNTSLR